MTPTSDAFVIGPMNNIPPETAMSLWFKEKAAQNEDVLRTLATHSPSTQVLNSSEILENTRKPLVAIVDDEVVIAVTLAELLGRHGFQAVWFTSPLRALEFLKRTRIDILLSDIQMPDLNGWQLSQLIADICPACPVLLLSGNPELLESLAQLRAKNHVFFAQKPIGVSELVTLLEALLRTSPTWVSSHVS